MVYKCKFLRKHSFYQLVKNWEFIKAVDPWNVLVSFVNVFLPFEKLFQVVNDLAIRKLESFFKPLIVINA